MRKLLRVALLLSACAGFHTDAPAQGTDTAFIQPVSVKYVLAPAMRGSTLKKVVTDYNDGVYVLTDKGVCRINGTALVKDLRYRPLMHKIPLDITVQENTGYLYYLYDSAFLSNAEAGRPYAALPPGRYNKMAVAADGSVLLAGDKTLGLFRDGRLTELPPPAEPLLAIAVFKGAFYALSSETVYRLSDGRLLPLHEGKGLQSFAFGKDAVILGTAGGYYGVSRSTGKVTLPLQTRLPAVNISALLTVNGKIWAGTPQGAFTEAPEGKYRYYASGRWLNEDSVKAMAADSRGNVYLMTASGLNEIRFIRQTFAGKAKYFQENIRQRHIRYGLLAEVRMQEPGDLSTAEMVDTDNDGLWTSFYLGSQAFRYAVTKDPMAKRYAWESFAAYERLVSVNPLKGFPSRTFERTGYKVSDPDKWRPSQDPGWEWKGTTSSDEFVGYIFVAALMDEFVAATAAEKKRVAGFIDKILTHIIQNDYNFVDADGQPTLWGRWNPDYINWYAKTIGDRKLGSTTIIAGLQLGYALTGKAIYKTEAMRLMQEHGYLENILLSPYTIKATPGYTYKGHDMGNGHWNHSDDEMAFLSYWVLYHYAFTPALRRQYATAIRAHWKIESPEKNPVWNLITLGTEGSFDKEATRWYLEEFPMDRIRWTVRNSARKDLTFREPGFRQQYTAEVLTPEEQPAQRYNANAFNLDGGDGGRSELTGAEYLLPYWMARYLKVLQ